MQQSANNLQFFNSTISSGSQLGRTIGYPTINLDSNVFPRQENPGVYACSVFLEPTTLPTKPSKRDPDTQINGEDSNYSSSIQSLHGALYFGPRLIKDETHNVLEIFLLNFEGQIYGRKVGVRLQSFIRPPLNFASFEDMKQQLEEDVERVRLLFAEQSIFESSSL